MVLTYLVVLSCLRVDDGCPLIDASYGQKIYIYVQRHYITSPNARRPHKQKQRSQPANPRNGPVAPQHNCAYFPLPPLYTALTPPPPHLHQNHWLVLLFFSLRYTCCLLTMGHSLALATLLATLFGILICFLSTCFPDMRIRAGNYNIYFPVQTLFFYCYSNNILHSQRYRVRNGGTLVAMPYS